MTARATVRTALIAAFTFALCLMGTGANAGAQVMDEGGRMHNYIGSLIGPGALFSIGASAAVDQARNSPAVWGKSGSGFGKRVASAAGARFANQTVRHGLAAVLDRSTSYTRCSCTAFPARLGHAIIGAVTDTDGSGHRTLSEPAIAGAVAGTYAPLLWRPNYTGRDAAQGIGLSLGFSALGNIVNEFILH